MITARTFTEQQDTPLYRDGLGERTVAVNRATGERVQVLHVHPALAAASSFEFALRERVASVASLRHPTYAAVRQVERVRMPDAGLTVTSDYVEGTRLSDLLSVARHAGVDLEISTALCLLRQIVPAIALLHGHVRGVAHGLIAPERLIVTRLCRVVVADHVFGSAIEALHLSPERLWPEFRIAVPSVGGPVRLDQRGDVRSLGLVALALVLGRPLEDHEVPSCIPRLLEQARERSALGYERPLSAPLRDWLSRALQLERARAFPTAAAAARALGAIAGDASLYVTASISLEMFLARCKAAHLPAASFQLPVASSQLPAAGFQLPAAGFQPPAASVQLPAVSFQPPAVSVQRPSAGSQPPAVSAQLQPVIGAGALEAGLVVPSPAFALPEMLVPPSDEIDWDSVTGQRPTAVVTAHDISALFSDTDSPTPDFTAPRAEQFFEAAFETPDPALRPDWLAWRRSIPVAVRSVLSRRTAVAVLLVVAALLGGGGFSAHLLRTGVAADSSNGTLVVQSTPAGLQVLIDDVVHGSTPARLSVAPGDHTLEVRGAVGARRIPFTMARGTEVGHHLEFPNLPQPTTPVVTATAARIEAGREGTTAPAAVAPAVESAPAWGWLAIKTPFPLEVRVGKRVLGTTDDQRIRIAPGRHEILLANDSLGYREGRVVQVAPGKVVSVAVDPPEGAVNINASPWAEVWIGSRRLGETPIGNVSVPVGRHVIVFKHPELGVKRQSIWVSLAEPARVSMDMR